MCVLPWMHLASHPNGGVSLCCRSNHTNAVSWAKDSGTTNLLTLSNASISEIMNSETFIRVRQSMIDGARPIECEGCWRDEDANIESKREYENKRWAHIIPTLEKTAVLKDPSYKYVELRLGNVCNNACITCNSFSSSKWYADEVKISKKLPWFTLRPLENFKWFDDPDFYFHLAEHSQEVEEIYINGGEPTLIKAHFEYLNHLLEFGVAENVHLVYSLNMMDIPDRLVELWKGFKKVTVNCSVDDVGDRNFYIRWPSKWEDTIASIAKLNTVPNVYWHVTQTVSILNIANLAPLDDWLMTTYGKRPSHNFVLYPDYLSLSAIPATIKDDLKALYAGKFDDQTRADLFAKIDILHDPACTIKARDFIMTLDQSRKLNYQDYIPELTRTLNDFT